MAKNLTVNIFSGKKEASSLTLPKEIFAVSASTKLITQYVYVYLNNLKKDKHQTKTRSMVRGSTRKIYKQKGTGRARHGDKQAPIFVGGGVAFGPTGEHRKLKLTKKMKRKALFYTLSLKASQNNIRIVADKLFDKIEKTKDAQALLTKLGIKENTKASIVLGHEYKARNCFNNISFVKVNVPSGVNAYRVLKASELIFSEQGLSEFTKLFKHE